MSHVMRCYREGIIDSKLLGALRAWHIIYDGGSVFGLNHGFHVQDLGLIFINFDTDLATLLFIYYSAPPSVSQ